MLNIWHELYDTACRDKPARWLGHASPKTSDEMLHCLGSVKDLGEGQAIDRVIVNDGGLRVGAKVYQFLDHGQRAATAGFEKWRLTEIAAQLKVSAGINKRLDDSDSSGGIVLNAVDGAEQRRIPVGVLDVRVSANREKKLYRFNLESMARDREKVVSPIVWIVSRHT